MGAQISGQSENTYWEVIDTGTVTHTITDTTKDVAATINITAGSSAKYSHIIIMVFCWNTTEGSYMDYLGCWVNNTEKWLYRPPRRYGMGQTSQQTGIITIKKDVDWTGGTAFDIEIGGKASNGVEHTWIWTIIGLPT